MQTKRPCRSLFNFVPHFFRFRNGYYCVYYCISIEYYLISRLFRWSTFRFFFGMLSETENCLKYSLMNRILFSLLRSIVCGLAHDCDCIAMKCFAFVIKVSFISHSLQWKLIGMPSRKEFLYPGVAHHGILNKQYRFNSDVRRQTEF